MEIVQDSSERKRRWEDTFGDLFGKYRSAAAPLTRQHCATGSHGGIECGSITGTQEAPPSESLLPPTLATSIGADSDVCSVTNFKLSNNSQGYPIRRTHGHHATSLAAYHGGVATRSSPLLLPVAARSRASSQMQSPSAVHLRLAGPPAWTPCSVAAAAKAGHAGGGTLSVTAVLTSPLGAISVSGSGSGGGSGRHSGSAGVDPRNLNLFLPRAATHPGRPGLGVTTDVEAQSEAQPATANASASASVSMPKPRCPSESAAASATRSEWQPEAERPLSHGRTDSHWQRTESTRRITCQQHQQQQHRLHLQQLPYSKCNNGNHSCLEVRACQCPSAPAIVPCNAPQCNAAAAASIVIAKKKIRLPPTSSHTGSHLPPASLAVPVAPSTSHGAARAEPAVAAVLTANHEGEAWIRQLGAAQQRTAALQSTLHEMKRLRHDHHHRQASATATAPAPVRVTMSHNGHQHQHQLANGAACLDSSRMSAVVWRGWDGRAGMWGDGPAQEKRETQHDGHGRRGGWNNLAMHAKEQAEGRSQNVSYSRLVPQHEVQEVHEEQRSPPSSPSLVLNWLPATQGTRHAAAADVPHASPPPPAAPAVAAPPAAMASAASECEVSVVRLFGVAVRAG